MKRIHLTKEQRAELLIRANILDKDGNYHKDFFSKETVEKSKAHKHRKENTMGLVLTPELLALRQELKNDIDELTSRIDALERLHDLEECNTIPFVVSPKLLEKDLSWSDAKKYCELLGNGWRVPTYSELKVLSKVSHSSHNAYDNVSHTFDDVPYWSMTKEKNSGQAWVINLISQKEYTMDKNSIKRVRPVRDLSK